MTTFLPGNLCQKDIFFYLEYINKNIVDITTTKLYHIHILVQSLTTETCDPHYPVNCLRSRAGHVQSVSLTIY